MSKLTTILILASKTFVAKASNNTSGIFATTANCIDFINENGITGIDTTQVDNTAKQAAYWISYAVQNGLIDKKGMTELVKEHCLASLASDGRIVELATEETELAYKTGKINDINACVINLLKNINDSDAVRRLNDIANKLKNALKASKEESKQASKEENKQAKKSA